MKWFKHDADARNSLKLRKVRRKFGADGYAIYWFCLEAIAHDIDKDNLTFELKEDAEMIAFELDIQEKRVEEIMIYLVGLGLFENSNNVITCLKLADRIDKSMTNSPKFREWLTSNHSKKGTDDVMTLTDNVNTSAELEEIRRDKKRKEKNNTPAKDKSLASEKELTIKNINKYTKQEIFENFNEVATYLGFSKINKITDARWKKIKLRGLDNKENFNKAITALYELSDFGKGFISFDYMIDSETKLHKLLEGNFKVKKVIKTQQQIDEERGWKL